MHVSSKKEITNLEISHFQSCLFPFVSSNVQLISLIQISLLQIIELRLEVVLVRLRSDECISHRDAKPKCLKNTEIIDSADNQSDKQTDEGLNETGGHKS